MMNTDHRVQGLDNDAVVADWPAISGTELAWLRGHYPALDGECRVLWHSPRPFSAAALVACGSRRCFVKRHHVSVRTAEVLTEEWRMAPGPLEVAWFAEETAAVERAVDALTKRLEKLEGK